MTHARGTFHLPPTTRETITPHFKVYFLEQTVVILRQVKTDSKQHPMHILSFSRCNEIYQTIHSYTTI